MSDGLAKFALGAYRMAGSLAYPMLGPYVGYRVSRGKEEGARRRERYGVASVGRPEGCPLVWVHAASVGESAAVAPLVRQIAGTGIAVLITTGTVTSAAMVEERLGDCTIHQYGPIDMKGPVNRFLDHWRPDLAIFVESELWPLTMSELGRRRIPQVLVNARLSDRSFKRWKSAHWLAEALFENVAHVVAQSDVDGERFHILGARAVTVAGNLKADTLPPPNQAEDVTLLLRDFANRPRWAAISTHAGEEKIAGDVHLALKERHPGLLTIVVPRHAERGEVIAKDLERQGLSVARRSLGQRVAPETDVLLGDTMGEMGLYLRLTGIVFMGKSLTAQGGQNPLEAAMLGSAILSGRYVQNFRDVYQRLLKNGGARLVPDADGLTQYVDQFFGEPDLRARIATAAGATVEEMRGALDRTAQALHPFLHPLNLALSLERRAGIAADR